jgi:hypothetical protein
MATRFFVCTRPQINGSYTVHREDCPFLPEQGRRILLGVFKFSLDAVKKGRRYCSRPESCLFCSKEQNEIKRPAFTEREANPDFISSKRLKTTWESLLFCSVS